MTTQDILQTIGILAAIAISGKLVFEQWKFRLTNQAFQNGVRRGANQAILTIIGEANKGKEFSVANNAQKVSLIKTNKEAGKKRKKK